MNDGNDARQRSLDKSRNPAGSRRMTGLGVTAMDEGDRARRARLQRIGKQARRLFYFEKYLLRSRAITNCSTSLAFVELNDYYSTIDCDRIHRRIFRAADAARHDVVAGRADPGNDCQDQCISPLDV